MERQIIYQGPGLLSILLVAFIILKLCNVITWSWWWVFSPIWIPFLFTLMIIIIMGFIVFIVSRD